MNRLSQVKALFDHCEPLSANGRKQALAQAHYDEDIIREVEVLLQLADQENSHHTHVNIISNEMLELSKNIEPGLKLNNYQIEKEIGRGGMGIVFLANRADGVYQQKVAIKIAPTFASKEEQLLFQQERQILARCQHPNIATLLDGGATDDNRPFFVMEYIEGNSITDYCREHQLSVTERIELFLNVCHAVSYAHKHLILHSDIKPENVLVTNQGQVKLLDFGVSKMLKAENVSSENSLSNMTLAYASPEQVQGKPITVYTDVYGLGSLLYEMLTGYTPHKTQGQATNDVVQTIINNLPIAPSKLAIASSAIQSKLLRGDIDNIVLKAISNAPADRYDSAHDFAKDLQRYLRSEPVLASKQSFSYKLKKLLKRHPLPFVLGSALSISLVTGLIISIDLGNQLSKEKKKLEQEVETSKEVIALLTNMFDAASPNNARGDDISVKELINAAVQHTGESLKHSPTVESKLTNVLANVQHKIGDEVASANLRKKAFAIKQQNLLPLTASDYAKLAKGHMALGEYADAEQALVKANGLKKEVDNLENALVESIWGNYYRNQNQEAQAIIHFESALKTLNNIQYPDDAWSLTVSREIAICYDALGHYDKAQEVLEQTIKKKQQLLGADHENLINDNTMLAYLYQKLGYSNRYFDIIQANYALAKKYYDINNSTLNYVVLNLVSELNNRGHFLQALNVLDDMITPQLIHNRSKGLLLASRGVTLSKLGLTVPALHDLNTSMQFLSPKWGKSLSIMFSVRHSQAELVGKTTSKDQGIELLNTLEAEVLESWGKHMAISSVWLAYVEIFIHHQAPDKAQPYLQKTQDLYDSALPQIHPAYKHFYHVKTKYHENLLDWIGALSAINKAIEIRNANLNEMPDRPSIGDAMMFLQKALYLAKLDKKAEALSLFQENAPIVRNAITADSSHHTLLNQLENILTP